MNAQHNLEHMSENDKGVLETIGMTLRDEHGGLRPWETIVNEFMEDIWASYSTEEKIRALLIIELIAYRLEHGFTW